MKGRSTIHGAYNCVPTISWTLRYVYHTTRPQFDTRHAKRDNGCCTYYLNPKVVLKWENAACWKRGNLFKPICWNWSKSIIRLYRQHYQTQYKKWGFFLFFCVKSQCSISEVEICKSVCWTCKWFDLKMESNLLTFCKNRSDAREVKTTTAIFIWLRVYLSWLRKNIKFKIYLNE